MGGRGGGQPGGQTGFSFALRGADLFNVQSLLLGRYLRREGYEFIGQLADAQIGGKTIEDALPALKSYDLTRMETDWRRWVVDRAAAAAHGSE
jgi:hypothetical protein